MPTMRYTANNPSGEEVLDPRDQIEQGNAARQMQQQEIDQRSALALAELQARNHATDVQAQTAAQHEAGETGRMGLYGDRAQTELGVAGINNQASNTRANIDALRYGDQRPLANAEALARIKELGRSGQIDDKLYSLAGLGDMTGGQGNTSTVAEGAAATQPGGGYKSLYAAQSTPAPAAPTGPAENNPGFTGAGDESSPDSAVPMAAPAGGGMAANSRQALQLLFALRNHTGLPTDPDIEDKRAVFSGLLKQELSKPGGPDPARLAAIQAAQQSGDYSKVPAASGFDSGAADEQGKAAQAVAQPVADLLDTVTKHNWTLQSSIPMLSAAKKQIQQQFDTLRVDPKVQAAIYSDIARQVSAKLAANSGVVFGTPQGAKAVADIFGAAVPDVGGNLRTMPGTNWTTLYNPDPTSMAYR